MKDCECLPVCPFFNDKMASKPATAEMFKKKYCLGDNSECARHLVFKALGRTKVPPDMYPTQADRAKQLIGGVRDIL